jgi:hypothetical protein
MWDKDEDASSCQISFDALHDSISNILESGENNLHRKKKKIVIRGHLQWQKQKKKKGKAQFHDFCHLIHTLIGPN